MPAFGQMLDDRETAAVITHIGNAWGNAGTLAPTTRPGTATLSPEAANPEGRGATEPLHRCHDLFHAGLAFWQSLRV